jgi:hypothetical protein
MKTGPGYLVQVYLVQIYGMSIFMKCEDLVLKFCFASFGFVSTGFASSGFVSFRLVRFIRFDFVSYFTGTHNYEVCTAVAHCFRNILDVMVLENVNLSSGKIIIRAFAIMV